jgi:hypothetical protein
MLKYTISRLKVIWGSTHQLAVAVTSVLKSNMKEIFFAGYEWTDIHRAGTCQPVFRVDRNGLSQAVQEFTWFGQRLSNTLYGSDRA